MKTYKDVVFEGISPTLHEKSYVAEGSNVVGDVTLGEYSSIWYNCSLRGDVNKIVIGRYSNVQDNSVVHVSDTHPTYIGDFVTIGHGAVVHACTIEDHVLVGMGAVVLDGVDVGRGSIIAAGAIVTSGTKVPPFSLVAGVPGKVIKQLPEDIASTHAQAVKYKTLWCERYGLLPDNDGEKYHGEKIVGSSKDK